MENSMLEGFICPECLKTLDSITHLEAHFAKKHSKLTQSSTKRDSIESEPVNLANSLSIYESSFWNQSEGISPKLTVRSHTDAFRKARSNFVGAKAIESNKTLIRLEKILAINDYNKSDNRKFHEKSLVPWVKDEDVPICPSCGKNFNVMLLRRKHHCRLCGSIMCQSCSRLISFTFADALIKSFSPKSLNKDEESDHVRLFAASSNFEVLSQQCSIEDEPKIKVCPYCTSILMRVTEQATRKLTNTAIEVLYKQLLQKMEEVQQIRPMFIRAAECLSKGESDFTFTETSEMRHKLLKCYEVIEELSKRIINCCGSSSQENKLALSIRKNAQAFLQQNLYALQSLPSREQYLLQKEIRKTAVLKKIEQDRQEASTYLSESPIRSTPSSSPERSSRNNRAKNGTLLPGYHKRTSSSSSSAFTNGFLPTASITDSQGAQNLQDDPILIQIRQVQGFLAQARKAGRHDEVEMLTENLKQLQGLLGPKSAIVAATQTLFSSK